MNGIGLKEHARPLLNELRQQTNFTVIWQSSTVQRFSTSIAEFYRGKLWAWCAGVLAGGVVEPLSPTDETRTAAANSVTVAARIRRGVSQVR
jgi:hypothetical protein